MTADTLLDEFFIERIDARLVYSKCYWNISPFPCKKWTADEIHRIKMIAKRLNLEISDVLVKDTGNGRVTSLPPRHPESGVRFC